MHRNKNTQTGTEECDGCAWDRKLSPLTGLPHCSPITLQLFKDCLCVVMCFFFFFLQTYNQFYTRKFNLIDLKIADHTSRDSVG